MYVEIKSDETQSGAKTINVFRACLGAQRTICAQKWRNFVLFSTVSLRFVLSRVCIFLYSLGPWSRASQYNSSKRVHGVHTTWMKLITRYTKRIVFNSYDCQWNV